MNLPRLACTLAAVLVPAGCFTPVPCDGSLCLSIADVSRVQVGVAPDALTIVDVDGDGVRDLVGASGPAGTVTVLWGGDTGFAGSATTWSIDQEVAGIVVADLDDDGHLDLATALPRADAVAVVRGRGGRSFAEPERFAAGAVPRALIAAELDGKGPPELVTADLVDGTVTVLHRLVAAPPLVVGPGPRALAAGDLDGDGDVDVAVALADADAVQLLHGDGRGALQPAALLPVGAAPYALVAADFDGDARLDLATADSLDDTVSVLMNAGAGEFSNREAWPTVSLPEGLVVTRPTDSLPVLGVLSPTTSTVERLDPRTGAAVPGVLATDARSLAADGDLFVGGGGALSFLNLGTGLIFTSEREDPGALDIWPVDLDGDGVDELLVRDLVETASGEFRLRRGDVEQRVHVGAGDPDRVQAGDLTGDGLGDLFFRDKSTLYVVPQEPSGQLGEAIVTAFDDLVDAVLADIDVDGVAEVVALVGADGGGRIEVYRSDAAGALTRALATTLDLDPPPDSLSVIDGDGDAAPDLLLGRYGSFFLVEDGHGPVRALDLGEHYPDDPAFADLDRDGRLDAVFCSRAGVFLAHDVLAPAPAEPVPLSSASCRDVALLDLDGDGELEILISAVFPYNEQAVVRLTPLRRSGQSYVASGSRIVKGFGGALLLAELDGAGPPELVFSTYQRTAVFRAELGLSLLETEHLRFDNKPRLRFGDVDGDGAAELLALGGSLAVAAADERGGFGPLTRLWSGREEGPQVQDALLADFDRDGRAQLLWTATRGDFGAIELASVGLKGLSQHTQLGVTFQELASRLFVADLDGDHELDVLNLTTTFGTLRGFLARGRGQGRFDALEQLSIDDQFAVEDVTLADVDRDGRADLIITAIGPSGSEGVYVLPGQGDVSFGPPRRWSHVSTPSIDPPPLRFADLDRDGAVELIMGGVQGSLLWIADGGRAPRVLLEDVDAYEIADLDRDGRPELLAAAPAPYSSETTRLHLGRSRSDGSFGFEHHDLDVADVRQIQTADVDGDGELDIVLVDDRGATILRRAP
ncbi:VCBS repeat-containing protein [Nannocystis sp. ILAH1]|uniref:FG-GAP repeat domain-containing protein n=1 Tax=Nannocystis sp. ILAH1 TaxID=2996789 RepID=UPI00226F32ED|nr:VCBS repeat-containing protein [Nannocystis sp. ILAH1]